MESQTTQSQPTPDHGLEKWIQFTQKLSLVWAGMCAGVVLYMAMFPYFYYMAWFAILPAFWGAVLVGDLLLRLVVASVALGRGIQHPFVPAGSYKFVAGLLVLVTALAGFKVPLHTSFLLAKSGLEQALVDGQEDLAVVGRWSHDFGLYHIGHAERRCHDKDRIYFLFQDDSESAIIYSETGIDDLCYNSGNKGHLTGNWYWMKED